MAEADNDRGIEFQRIAESEACAIWHLLLYQEHGAYQTLFLPQPSSVARNLLVQVLMLTGDIVPGLGPFYDGLQVGCPR